MLGATLSASVVIVMVVGLGVFGVSLLGSQFQFAPPPDKVVEETPDDDGDSEPGVPVPAPEPAEPEDPILTAGISTYNTLCTTCHGADGKGMPNNMAPGLAESEFVNGP
ncbi:MAG: hypothetical protein AAF585_16850, partial [Verrucomicrobiota bacterium]